MQLQWDDLKDGKYSSASTPFGFYAVSRKTGIGWQWGYCFDEYYDEGQFACESMEEGKRLANEDWQERIAPIIAPYVKIETA